MHPLCLLSTAQMSVVALPSAAVQIDIHVRMQPGCTGPASPAQRETWNPKSTLQHAVLPREHSTFLSVSFQRRVAAAQLTYRRASRLTPSQAEPCHHGQRLAITPCAPSTEAILRCYDSATTPTMLTSRAASCSSGDCDLGSVSLPKSSPRKTSMCNRTRAPKCTYSASATCRHVSTLWDHSASACASAVKVHKLHSSRPICRHGCCCYHCGCYI